MARFQGQGQGHDTPTRATSVHDFVERYMRGAPAQHISGEEALLFFDAIYGSLSPAELEQAAEAAFLRMQPDERQQLAHYLRERAHEQEFDFPELSPVNERAFADPTQLARIVSGLENKQQGILREMLVTGGPVGGEGSLVREGRDFVHGPLFKATIGGIAAFVMARRAGLGAGAAPGASPR